ncbi:hypothetical protein OQA88_4796 [Cercophora sp. LCS_1]
MAGAQQRCPWVDETLHRTLPSFLRAVCSPTGALSTRSEDDDFLDGLDPEKREYLRQLIVALFEARTIVASYNLVIVAFILLFTFLNWRRAAKDRRKWGRIRASQAADEIRPEPTSSSSSSTLQGSTTPPNAVKLDASDVERLPLVASKPSRRPGPAVFRAVSSWLARQPPPIPVINRTLPSNATSLFVTTWMGLNVFFHFYRLPMRWDFFFIFADRAGLVFVVNLPILYLLGAKNQPLRRLTGYSYEALNIFHRRVGELMCFEALVHFISMVVWQFLLMEDWMKGSTTPKEYWTHPIIVFGICAFSSYEMLYFTSLGSFRQRWYELFLASHVFLQAGALAFLWFHYPTSQPWVLLALIIFAVDRLVWRFGLKRSKITADLSVLEDGETFLVSADWDILTPAEEKSSRWWPSFLQRHSILHGWEPTDHVFLTVPALGRSFDLQAHPFTIASAAPGVVTSANDESVHAWFSLLIRAYDGFTAELLRYAQTNGRVPVVMDGPYGSSHALEMLRASERAILVAGGSGIAVTFPLVWALLHESKPREADTDAVAGAKRAPRQRVHLLWVTHSRSHRSWVPEQQLDELVARGLDLVIPEPTVEAGRPNVAMYVKGWIEDAAANGEEVSVVVSGPDGLNRSVRNACADEIGAGLDVRMAVEKFGW